MLFGIADMSIAKSLFIWCYIERDLGQQWLFWCSMTTLNGHMKIPLFQEKTQNLNLTHPKEVILFSRHSSSETGFYLVLTEGNLGKQYSFMFSVTPARGHVNIFFPKNDSKPQSDLVMYVILFNIHVCSHIVFYLVPTVWNFGPLLAL